MKYFIIILLSICCSLLCRAQDTLKDNKNALTKIKEFDSLWRVSHITKFINNKSSNISDLSIYSQAVYVKDSLDTEDYNESSYLLSAYLLIPNTNISFKTPNWYKGKIDKFIYALILLDDVGFCEEFYIMQGVDEQLDKYVEEYFRNMPKVKYMRLTESNPPKSKVAIKKKIIPLVISFVSETSMIE